MEEEAESESLINADPHSFMENQSVCKKKSGFLSWQDYQFAW